MSTDLPEPNLDALRRLIEARGAASAASDAAERIARSLLSLPPADLACADVQAELPAYVEAELRGAAPTPAADAIRAHLQACAECGPLYADMLQAELDWRDDAAAAPELPALRMNLDFLPRADPFERLRAFVTDLAREIITALQPAALPQLSYLLDPFFERARQLPTGAQMRPSVAAGALGLGGRGGGRLPAAAVYLGASFLATRELSRGLNPERIAALRAEGRFEQEARRVALRAAADAGLAQPDALRFADEFARQILAAAGQLPTGPAD